jgi:hypothetical protein
MQCLIPNCEDEVSFKCKSCEFNLLCLKHGNNHDDSHSVIRLSKEEIKSLLSMRVNSEIDICISRIAKDSQEFISIIKRLANEAISEVREANQNISNMSEFRRVVFDGNAAKNLMQKAKLFKPDIKVLKSGQLDDVSEEMKRKDDKIEMLKKEISELKVELKKVGNRGNDLGREKDDSLLGGTGEKRTSSRSRDGGSENQGHRRARSDVDQDDRQRRPREERKEKSKDFVDFNSRSFEEKKKYISDNWNFVSPIGLNDIDYLLSNDGLLLYRCMRYFGL